MASLETRYFSVITKNLNREISTTDVVTFNFLAS